MCVYHAKIVVNISYAILIDEGMDPLPGDRASSSTLPDSVAPLAFKYCGGGYGGYALYVFDDKAQRDFACTASAEFYSIEPSVAKYH